ncbi:MAG TPA: CehA/McbA family metallohydrolase, partial [Polyangia bacterium]|nr:CehA/McbA family metallohydrolase [Polyangia bacterium]
FRAPELNIRDVASAWREWPFVAARPQAAPNVSYAVVSCDDPSLAGFNDTTLTASGVPLSTTLPGDGIHFERFILAKKGPGLADAVGEALHVRAMVHGDPEPVTVIGRVVAGGVPIEPSEGRAASLMFYEPALGPDPDDPARRKPWSEAVPSGDGTFSVKLPPDRTYRVQPYAFGLPAAAATSFAVARAEVNLGDISMQAAAHLVARVTFGQESLDKTYAELVLVPANAPTGSTPVPSFYGLFPGCDPMLGPPYGGLPACNRVVTDHGVFDILIPPGSYHVYATRGPFATIDRATITVAAGSAVPPLAMVLQPLPLLPAGALSGDFHVHGGASFDTSIPDQTRVVSFLASGVDVVVATDHDVVTTYRDTIEALGATGKIAVISGTEQTPNIPWFTVPGNDLPTTLGHFNFWPLIPDANQPRNGAPWDELREPGQMMDDMDALFVGTGVRQLNHPFADAKLGRDQGFLRAIGYDLRTPIAAGASFAADVLLRAPGGTGHHSNLDWDVQEVMTGTSVENWLRYRALWFSMLSQGIVRAGAANSDTHSLGPDRVGYPRNIVLGTHQRDALDVEAFDADVRRGHMIGTNGPVLDVTIKDGDAIYPPGLDPIRVSSSAQLVMTVSFAPWIPVTEIRVIINGVVQKIALDLPADHFGTQIVRSTPRSLALSGLLPPG